MQPAVQLYVVLLLVSSPAYGAGTKSVFGFSDEQMEFYRNKTRDIFFYAYENYLHFAYPFDELKPISCAGMDTWGSFSLSLIDSLDMLIIMGRHCEFQRAVNIILQEFNTTADINVSVFETNIRVIGGLLSAHILSKNVGVEFRRDWPCRGPLLELAERVAQRLLPAFFTNSGMPYGTVNLLHGVCKNETPITCTASIGTFLLEFGTLSHLTGNPIYEDVALRALKQLWSTKSTIGLVGNHINVQTMAWTATDSGIGGGVDSYFEYLVKGGVLFNRRLLIEQFNEYRTVIDKYVRRNYWYPWVSMYSGSLSLPIFQSLEAFWPGLLTLVGDVETAHNILLNYNLILNQYGMTPEFYDLHKMEAHNTRTGYPLRPELTESLMYMYRATGDAQLLRMGASIIEAIERGSKTNCGFATVYNVLDHSIEDRMESFFLAETTKYLYLLFDPANPLHRIDLPNLVVNGPKGKCLINRGGHIFNTEAHPLDASANYCCGSKYDHDNDELAAFGDSLDLTTLLPVSERHLFHDFYNLDTEKPIGRGRKCRIDMYPMLLDGRHTLDSAEVRRLKRLFPNIPPDELTLPKESTLWRSRLPVRRIMERVEFLMVRSCKPSMEENDKGPENPAGPPTCSVLPAEPKTTAQDRRWSMRSSNRNILFPDADLLSAQCSADLAPSLKPQLMLRLLAKVSNVTVSDRHFRYFVPDLHRLQCQWLAQVSNLDGNTLYPELGYFRICNGLATSTLMDYDSLPSSMAEFCSLGPYLRRFSIAGEVMG